MLGLARDRQRPDGVARRRLNCKGREEQGARDQGNERKLDRVLFSFARFEFTFDLPSYEPLARVVGKVVGERERGVACAAVTRLPPERWPDRDRDVHGLAKLNARERGFGTDEVQNLVTRHGLAKKLASMPAKGRGEGGGGVRAKPEVATESEAKATCRRVEESQNLWPTMRRSGQSLYKRG